MPKYRKNTPCEIGLKGVLGYENVQNNRLFTDCDGTFLENERIFAEGAREFYRLIRPLSFKMPTFWTNQKRFWHMICQVIGAIGQGLSNNALVFIISSFCRYLWIYTHSLAYKNVGKEKQILRCTSTSR